MPINEWWSKRPDEHFWLEVTDRQDLGANLKAPQTNEKGKEFWSYSLLKYVRPKDIIFHYDKSSQAIIASSVATGQIWEDDVVWAAKGTSARNAGVEPHTRLGWYVGLEQFSPLKSVIQLDQIRSKQFQLISLKNQLASSVGEPLYFPFEISASRPLRPMQGYLFKLPVFFISEFFKEPRERVIISDRSATQTLDTFGALYRHADESTSVGQRDPFSVDPALVERALRGHASTQNGLAAFLRAAGIEPRSPNPNEPNFDLAWSHNGVYWVAEVKSLTAANEEKQLRLGLGQLLRYKQLLSTKATVRAVLVTECRPSDPTWEDLCQQLGILLVWPSSWQERIPV
jgi:hypothetical protein